MATAKVIDIKNHRPALRLQCSHCGAGATAACECGAPYVPAGKRAEEAVAANPEKSDRAIAAAIGVSHTTVQKARKATGNKLPVDEKRTGKDGKQRKLPEPTREGAVAAVVSAGNEVEPERMVRTRPSAEEMRRACKERPSFKSIRTWQGYLWDITSVADEFVVPPEFWESMPAEFWEFVKFAGQDPDQQAEALQNAIYVLQKIVAAKP
jgi:hypothetical protein